MRVEQGKGVGTKARFPVVWVLCALTLVMPRRVEAQSYGVTVEHNAVTAMRDGAKLRADIYRPNVEGKFPVLLVRTPYDKTQEMEFGAKAAGRGYVVVAQDVRGRFQSEGDWYPFKHESQDGYDTVEWAAALPYANGKVGMFGGSYVGATQMLAAIATPPHLAGVFAVVTASNYHDGWTYQGGAFEQWFNESWTTGLVQDTLDRRVRESANALKWVWKLPLIEYPFLEVPSPASLAPYFSEWTRHPDFDDYWKPLSIEDHYANVRVPVYSVGGWYDIFQGGAVGNYVGLKSRVPGQRLIVGPWYHGPFNGQAGELNFGAAAK